MGTVNQPDGNGDQETAASDRRVIDLEDVEDVDLSPSELFGLLADTRERYVLYYLIENDGSGNIEEVVPRLAAWENDTTVDGATEEMIERVRATLHHADVPTLADYGLIEFDERSGDVVASELTEEIELFLELAERIEHGDFEAFVDHFRSERDDD